MSRTSTSGRALVIGVGVGMTTVMTCFSPAMAHPANRAIARDDLKVSSSAQLPLDILRRVARDYATRGDPVSCRDLRRCDGLDLQGIFVDLDGDGAEEWFVTDVGFTGTGAELDYVFKRGTDRRWTMIGRIEGLHVRTFGPATTGGFLDINGFVAGRCVEGRGKAIWNGRRYVERVGRVKTRPC